MPGRPVEGASPGRVSRRSFLRAGGSALASLALGALPPPSERSTARRVRGRSAGSAGGRPLDWHDLEEKLGGRLVLPADPSYGSDKLLYDERFDGLLPAAIAFCEGASDVQRCLEFVRSRDLPCAVRSGGHSYGGYSLSSGLVIDVTQIAGIVVSAPSRRATIGAGARLIDIYGALSGDGLLLPGGSCPTVGIAGLTLGGGVGVFDRRYGLTCDNLVSLRLVKADGELVTCDGGTNEDLFWACRGGGGGNFGVVTSFTFALHPIPEVSLFTLDWPPAAATQVLAAWQSWVGDTPDELWSNCQLNASASGVSVRVAGVFCGGTGPLQGVLAPLLAAVGGAPSYQFVGPDTYLSAMLAEAGCQGLTTEECHLPSQNPMGVLGRSAFAAKSLYCTRPLSSAVVEAAVGALAALPRTYPQIGGSLVFDSYGGQIATVRPAETAFVHRDALVGIQLFSSWGPTSGPGGPSAAESWLAEAAASLAPGTSGAYVNYIDPTLSGWERAYYGRNLERLVEVKRAVDPDDVFHFAQSVPTRLAGVPARGRKAGARSAIGSLPGLGARPELAL